MTQNGNHSENGSDLATKQVFTTGEAAELCKVSQQTIIRCFDAGRLQGFRVPGSRFRRIPREELIRFMHENEIPTDMLNPGKKRVLVVDDDPAIIELMKDLLGDDPRLEIHTASTGYEAGLQTEQIKPDLMILDYMLPDINGNGVCEAVRRNESVSRMRILIVSGVVDQQEVAALLESGADGFIKKPFDLDALRREIHTQLNFI